MAVVSFMTARDFGNYRYFGAYEWTAVTIDVLFAASINLVFFGIGPAVLRRSRAKKTVRTRQIETLPLSKYFAIALAVVFVTSTVGILSSDDNFAGIPDGVAQTDCRSSGADEVCIEVTYEGNKQLSFLTTWKYSTETAILGQSISRITWETKIDCNNKSGVVVNLNAFRYDGLNVEIGEAKQTMIDGINESEVQRLITASCES